MGAKRIYRFAYYAYLPTNDPRLPHKQRDGDAFIELAEALRDDGYGYAGLLLNPPAAADPTLQLDTDDLLVLTTRLPLDDDHTKRRIVRSHSALESRILSTLRPFFATCAVDHIVLGTPVVAALGDHDLRIRSDVVFWTNQSTTHSHVRSAYKAHREAHSDLRRIDVNGTAPPRTMAYLVLLRSHAWPGGPGLLCSFSVGGTPTLVWNHFLRVRPELRHLVRDPGSRFVLADLSMDPPVSGDWIDLRPADTWRVRHESVRLYRNANGTWAPQPR